MTFVTIESYCSFMPKAKPFLRKRRQDVGLKVSQLADRIPALDARHLANVESGCGLLSIELASLIAKELGCERSEILDEPASDRGRNVA